MISRRKEASASFFGMVAGLKSAISINVLRICGACVLCVLASVTASADERLQIYLNRIMRGRQGCVVVSKPTTGEIVAEWNHEMSFNHAFPPGSTAKLVTAAIALEEGKISPTDSVFCRRVPELLGEAYRCSHPAALGPYTLSSALANSCNYFFATLSTRLSADVLARGYAMFGVGNSATSGGVQSAPASVRIPDEPAAKARVALGESYILVTPAQLLMAYSAVATRGSIFRLWRSTDARTAPIIERRLKLQSATWETLARGLEECVRQGTGHAAAVEGVRVAGKTGTATIGGGKAHAWFVGYAPVDSPRIALVVLLARGTGARDAAPLAGRILRQYFVGRK